MKAHIVILVGFLLVLAPGTQAFAEDAGYFDRPRVYIDDDIAIPTVALGTGLPRPNYLSWNFSSAHVSSDKFKMDGTEVQKYLSVRRWTLRLTGEKLVGKTGVGLSIPIDMTDVKGQISSLPASARGNSIGDISLFAKHRLWQGSAGESVTFAAGVELPTGKDNLRFRQSNASTNAFYSGSPDRVPLGWQPGSGSTDILTALAYNKSGFRKAYEAVLAAKFHGKGDESVKLGDVWVLGLNTTQALSANFAASLGITYRHAGDDSYPNISNPANPALIGTVHGGNSLYVSPSILYRTGRDYTIGFSFKIPVSKPSSGLVPETNWGVVFSL